MTWRSILVHLDNGPRCDARVDLAARLARDRDARLVGVAPTGWAHSMLPVLPLPAGAELALAVDQLQQEAEAAVQRFRDRWGARPLPCAEAFVDPGDAASIVVERGHCSDLIVLGQADPAEPGHPAARAFVERVVLQASRPVLVVPFAGRFETVGRAVVAAWDGGREAARAVADAMPVLCSAADVQLVSFTGREGDAADARLARSLNEVAQWLQWHGVRVELRPQALADLDVGSALLSFAADAGADLVVMGAYGHPRWSERVLGGATRTMLRHMTTPVLMSR